MSIIYSIENNEENNQLQLFLFRVEQKINVLFCTPKVLLFGCVMKMPILRLYADNGLNIDCGAVGE
jgi:hypothetical protein